MQQYELLKGTAGLLIERDVCIAFCTCFESLVTMLIEVKDYTKPDDAKCQMTGIYLVQ